MENRAGARDSTDNLGTPCSLQLPGIHFTRCLNQADEYASIDGAAITISSAARRDYFNDPNGKLSNNTAPVLLAELDNTRPFTLTAMVRPGFHTSYDAGALYLFASERLWQKFALERDERGVTRVVSVRTVDTSDDNNHQSIAAPEVYLKISSDTRTVGLYFSTDKVSWNLARLYGNDYPPRLYAGLSSQSPLGSGNASTFIDPVLSADCVNDFRLGV
ncbi:DUF1349 domain-containing protein [Janthinobacterium aquaticum]|uniref:DUF1349 domain-containing protein n=1 Tax=Janthinobacterium sp. FT58W TaxID=2654254 RepID=UPI001D02C0F8|nr:DUF1349 domain-containing protein [Janthinobacterium sp. FT58W]